MTAKFYAQLYLFKRMNCLIMNMYNYLILPMKYGAILVKYISYFLKINMKYKYESGRSQNSYLF
jgi:hypothetical protein